AVVFKLTNVVCESYNKSWFVFNQCRLRAVSRNKVVLNLNGTLLYPANDIQAHYKMFKRENGYKPWLINNKLDCCRFWRKQYDPFYKIVVSLLSEFTNMNHTCPYVGPQILKGFYLKPELLLLPFPTGNYMLSLRWYYDQRLQVDTNVSFEFIEDIKTG
ncbi:hypothetical protein KR032_003207, partial [Drosophila birchii]